MTEHHIINYLEIPVKDIQASKAFLSKVFGWGFVDYGPDYSAITDAGIDAGIFSSDLTVSVAQGSILLVIYSEQLEDSQSQVNNNGGTIIKPIFSFPGGRRFHFSDPNGNEYAIWSDK